MVPKILITDESRTTCKIIQQSLISMKAEFQIANTAEQCNKIVEEWKPNLITLSVTLPKNSGIDVCRQLKKNPMSSHIPVIVISSFQDETLQQQALEAGAIDYFIKPIPPKYLQDRIDLILSKTLHNYAFKGEQQNVLVAEDSKIFMQVYENLLPQVNCKLIPCKDGQIAWDTLQTTTEKIDLIISDINMPHMEGTELVELIRANSRFDQIPIIISTTIDDINQIKMLLNLGANDYITKPFSNEEFNARVGTHLRTRRMMKEQERLNRELTLFNQKLEEKVLERTIKIREANVDTIFMLALASDAKDKDTANHVRRVHFYCEAIAKKLGFDERMIEEIGYSSMMHDVGKISIPDHILNKPAKLTEAEIDVMRTHPIAGAKILGEKPFFKTARQIARHHHEKYDGTGYPDGLKGAEIPISARIVAVADVYDALSNKRVYKPAWDEDKVLEELKRMSPSHLDPKIIKVFFELVEDGTIREIREKFPN
ncbi:MAG: putative two-component system response regulator [bacterium]|jgi:putative two-component system response regulator